MEDIKFGSLQELFIRVKPALRSKVKERVGEEAYSSGRNEYVSQWDDFNAEE